MLIMYIIKCSIKKMEVDNTLMTIKKVFITRNTKNLFNGILMWTNKLGYA